MPQYAFELRPIRCPTCELYATQIVGLRGGKYHRYRLGIVSRIVRCGSCSLLFPDPFPVPLSPGTLYGDPSKYFAAFDEEKKVDWYRALVKELQEKSGKRDLAVLDVGSGQAEFLRAAKSEGLTRILGLDFAESMIKRAKEVHNIEVLLSTIEDLAKNTEEKFDAITLNAVLEHVYDPNSMIASAKNLLRPKGILYLDIPQEPNLLSYAGNTFHRLVGNPAVYDLAPTWPPYHVFGFSKKAIRKLLQKHGFSIIELVAQSGGETILSTGGLRDKVQAMVATQINRLANFTSLASNMYIWAVRGS
jgi:ubiquinone/menaquinone biosynthesis C-methylase UbiE